MGWAPSTPPSCSTPAQIVGGVNARKAGTSVELGGQELPVYGSVKEAMAETGADVSVVFVPPAFTKDACIEAIDAGIGLLVVITEGVPVQDTAEVSAYLEGKSTRMIGPNCPGIVTPEESLAGSRRTRSRARVRSGWCPSRAR